MREPLEEYRASGLGQVAGRIRELAVPERPRFVSDLLSMPTGAGTYLFGGEPQRLQGSTEWLLARLAPLLDGTRTLAELQAALPELSPESFRDVLHLLQLHGMLEAAADPQHASDERALEAAHGSAMRFFSRYLRVTGSCADRYQAQRKLLAARVLVGGEEETAAIIAEQLRAHGVRAERACSPTDELALIIHAGDHASRVEAAQRAGAPMLSVDPGALMLGPLTVARITACPECVRLQRRHEPAEAPADPRVAALWRRVLALRAVERAIAYLTMLFQVESLGEVERLEPVSGRASRDRDILRLPSCPACGARTPPLTLTFPTGHQESMAMLFHRGVAITPWQLGQPSLMQQHISAGVIRTLRTAYAANSGAPATELTPRGVLEEARADVALSGGERGAPAECDLERLSAILRYSGGGRARALAGGGFAIERYTASGGNLGSAELYLSVRRARGLAPGIYHYLLTTDSLERLGEARAGEADPDVSIFVVSDVAREFSKYSNRGYQYCLLDAGLMAHRLALLAGQLGLRAELSFDFDDGEVLRRLGLERSEATRAPYATPFPRWAPACAIALFGEAR